MENVKTPENQAEGNNRTVDEAGVVRNAKGRILPPHLIKKGEVRNPKGRPKGVLSKVAFKGTKAADIILETFNKRGPEELKKLPFPFLCKLIVSILPLVIPKDSNMGEDVDQNYRKFISDIFSRANEVRTRTRIIDIESTSKGSDDSKRDQT